MSDSAINTTWKSSKPFFWETAPFFKLLVPVVVAIALYDNGALPIIEKARLIFAVVVSLIVTAVLLLARLHNFAASLIKTTCVSLSVFGLAWLLCCINDTTRSDHWVGKTTESKLCTGQVLTEPVPTEKTWKFRMQLESSDKDGIIKKTDGRGIVYVYKGQQAPNIHKGDRIVLPNAWTPIRSAGNPFEFDYSKYCRRNGFTHQQFTAASTIRLIDTNARVSSIIDKTHSYASGMLANYINDTATLGLLQAMLLGDETNFNKDTRQDYAETGIIHIVAISGSHVMLLFQLISLLFFWLRNNKWSFIKYLFAVPIVCFYVMVAGTPVSAVRSAIMFSFIAVSLLFQKDRQALNQLLLTAFFMLLYEPMWLFSVGFQLSFVAVLSLIIFYKPLFKLAKPKNRITRTLWQIVIASIAAEILTAPIVIFYFHLFPLGFIIANVLAYLFMGIVLALGLLIIAVGKVSAIAKALVACVVFFVGVFNAVIHALQTLNPTSFKYIYISLAQIALVYVVISGIGAYWMTRKRTALAIGLAASCLLMTTLVIDRYYTLIQEKLVVYNTGKHPYAELIHGTRYTSLITDTTNAKAIDYARREMHIVSHAWTPNTSHTSSLIRIGKKSMLILNSPSSADTGTSFNVDYLLLNYPVEAVNTGQLRKQYHFQQLIITGTQRRKNIVNWQESCARQGIPAHFTALDGAWVLAAN